MNKFLTVLTHSYMTNARSKTFRITTVIMAIFIVILFSLPNILAYFDDEEGNISNVGVIDNTEEVYAPLADQLEALNYNDLSLIAFNSEEEAKNSLQDGKIKSYIIVDSAVEGSLSVIYKAPEVNNAGEIRKLEQGLNQVQFRLKAEALDLSVEQASQLFLPVSLEKVSLDEDAKTEEEMMQSVALVYILLFAIYFGVLFYGNLVATEIAKEKSSRVMEILISSVNPVSQMFGKIFGIALLGLTQASLFVLVGYLTLKFGDKKIKMFGTIVDFSHLPTKTIVSAIVFFLLGYLLFATLAAMLGSLVSRIEELQQTLTPLTLLIVAAFMIAMFGLNAPDSRVIIVTSFIPIFSPMIMFLRIGVSNPATWEILLSIGLMILSIILGGIFAAKVYRGGVLMYGKGSAFKNLRYAIKLHNIEK